MKNLRNNIINDGGVILSIKGDNAAIIGREIYDHFLAKHNISIHFLKDSMHEKIWDAPQKLDSIRIGMDF